MTTQIPGSWELPSYLAGDLIPFRQRGDWEATSPAEDAPNARVFDLGYTRAKKQRELHPRGPGGLHTKNLEAWEQDKPSMAYLQGWETPASRLGDIEPYDPEKHGGEPAELYSQDALDALERSGFAPHESGVWHRQVFGDDGEALAHHYLSYNPGNRRTTDNSRAPWVLMINTDDVGQAFPTYRSAIAAADADEAQIRKMPKHARLYLAMVKVAVELSRARRDADDWLERNTPESFEHDPREEARRWMDEHADEYTHWNPSSGDYTYPDFGDVAGQSFHGDESQSHVLPGSAYDFGDQSGHWDSSSQLDDDYETPEHEQNLADLGFNYESRTHAENGPLHDTWVRGQHDPEGNYIATHTLWNGGGRWHLEHEPADTTGFAESYTQHQFPHDAINRYHQNAEEALLPRRGYEPHRGRSGAITHWTRVDTDPQTGAEYHHEISNQPPSGEGNHPGWLGQTFASHFHSGYAPNQTRNQNVQTDLADVVREHDRIGRGLHPGGSQDHRITRDEFMADPSVSRLGTPSWVSHDDGKVGAAVWKLPHPNPPRQTVFDPTAPGHAREVESDAPWINAEARYNWDKGGYDFSYSHNGERIWPTSEHFPTGAPVHVPGRQTSLPI